MMKLVIPEPCKQNWNEMQPVSDGRFCSSCAKNVVDFTGFTDAQLSSYFKSYPKNVCGKLSSRQIDRNLAGLGASALSKVASAPKNYSLRPSPLFVGLGFSLLNFTSCIPSTGKVKSGEVEITETRKADPSPSSENFSASGESQLNDTNSKDMKSEGQSSVEPTSEEMTLGETVSEETTSKETASEETASEETVSEKTESKDHDLKEIELQSKRDANNATAIKPGEHLTIRPVNAKQNRDLLPARISNYLTNASQFIDTIITGIVKDTSGLPIAGSTVVIYGSQIGVVTNADGRFLLIVPPEQTSDQVKLSIQFIGYNEKLLSVQAGFSRDLNISLVPVDNVLTGEVVIVGGIWVKPTIWQRIKNLVTFWK